MTHEELLAHLNPDQWVIDHPSRRYVETLRTVVELHKPVISALPDKTCLACQDLYPCITIQAIEKELQ